MKQGEADQESDGGKLWRIAIAMMAVAAGIVGLFWFWPSLDGPPKLVESQSSSTNFFRLKASYIYKGKSGHEPLDFDIVAGCAVQITKYITGDAPGISTRAPTMYALPTSDGAVVMVEVPRACGGATTENGLVPQDFLPATVTYESKDDLSVGKLYASDGAYDGPLSKLEFKGATIEAASKEDFRAFITGDGFKKNLITLKSSTDLRGAESRVYFTDELKEHPERVWKQRMPASCMGAMRLKVPEELRAYLRTLWKPGGLKYWFVSREHSGEMITWLRGIKASTGRKRPFPRIYFDGKSFNDYAVPFEAWGTGMLRRDGSGSHWRLQQDPEQTSQLCS